MKFAAITPTGMLGTLAAVRLTYHMALGQELVRDKIYREFFDHRARHGHFIIVDNGAAEPEEERVPFEAIVRVANEINADEIVLPDIIGDAVGTIESILKHQQLVPARKRVVIPQGTTVGEWCECFDTLYKKLPFATIGIPKHLERWPNGRLRALQHVQAYEDYHIHFFGVHNNPKDEILRLLPYARRVRGLDTGAPYAYAQNGASVESAVHYSLDWHKGADSRLAETNINMIRRWCEVV